MPKTEYKAQSARDAANADGKFGGTYGSESYWDYLEEHAHKLHAYFTARGDHATAEAMLTRSLSESLMGNDGD